MTQTSGKRIVCVTGTVWTGSPAAPRHKLVRDGFKRPTWFTTSRPIHDGSYNLIDPAEFQKAKLENRVLAYIKHAGDYVGIMKADLEEALAESPLGALIACPQEIASQIAGELPRTIVFVLKDIQMELCPELSVAQKKGQLHRIDVDILAPGAWTEVHEKMSEIMGLPVRAFQF